MSGPQAKGRDPLGTQRWMLIFAVLGVVFLVALAAAPARDYFSEWRSLQNQYNREAAARGLAPIDVRIRQTWNPDLGVVDRCSSCHLGMGEATPLPGTGIFEEHPSIPHEPAEMGCTLCHRGQGRATSREAAHGYEKHWEAPMLAGSVHQAGCGGCHSHLSVADGATVAQGAYLFDLHGCGACHVVNGEGGPVGPDLSHVGLKGYDRSWHIRHLKSPEAAVVGSRMMSFGHLEDNELDAIVTYLTSLVGAPRLMDGKLLSVDHGCRGCHRIGDVGGDHGPDLTAEGLKAPGRYDFTGVRGEHSVENWHLEHLLDPPVVTADSQMPRAELSEKEAELLTTFVLSLRGDQVPTSYQPRDRLLAQLTGSRDFPADGPTLYRAFCSACHGGDAAGGVVEALGTTVPGPTGTDFLAVASDGFLRTTLELGRPGRFMSAWGNKDGGLAPDEVERIIAWFRSHESEPPSFDQVQAVSPDRGLGERLYGFDCAVCHGERGQGLVGPALNNQEFLRTADDQFLHATITRGRPDTAMPAHRAYSPRELRSLIAVLRGWQREPSIDVDSIHVAGSPARGGMLYRAICSSCHGLVGEGGVGPALNNRVFLDTASDGFLAVTLQLGRGERPMRPLGHMEGGFADLNQRDIGDLVSFIRSFDGRPGGDRPLGARAQGIPSTGEKLYQDYCVSCHGPEGQGLTAPALTNPGFLAAATDGFLQATVLLGRRGTAMRAWGRGGFGFAELDPREVDDIITYIRSFETPQAAATRGETGLVASMAAPSMTQEEQP